MNYAALDPRLQDRILERWPSSTAFYDERDDRTTRGTEGAQAFNAKLVEVFLDPSCSASNGLQQLALIVCNLMSRWARNVTVILPKDLPIAERLGRGQFDLLTDRLSSEMRTADPFGNFQFVADDDYQFRSKKALRLFLGPWTEPLKGGLRPNNEDFVVSATAEFALARRGEPVAIESIGTVFTPALALAAAIGVADVFKRAVGHPPSSWIPSFNWDLLDHSTPTELTVYRLGQSELVSNIGRVLLAGVGAIGSSLAYLLDLASAEGYVCLLDRDRVETSNLNRSLIFDIEHALENQRKTEVVERFLMPSPLIVSRLDGTWREMSGIVDSRSFDAWVSFTNEDAAWAEIPFQLPPIVLQGTTTSGWGFGAGRHIPRKEDCTLCRMPRPEVEFRGPCAEGEIEPIQMAPPIRAALPFLSAASASLVLAELFKLNLRYVGDLPNDVAADLKTGLPAIIATKHISNPACNGCKMSRLSSWEERGGRGRHRNLSLGG